MNFRKKLLSLSLAMSMILSIGTSSFALSVPAGGSAFTSKKYLGTTHTTYHCSLDSVKFSDLEQNVIPTNKYVYARIYTEMGTACGDLAGFSRTGLGYDYNYYSGFGGVQWYKLKTNSNYGSAYTASFTWWP